MENWKNIEARKVPVKVPHYQVDFPGGPTHSAKKKIDYEYYICDYCGEHINLEKDREKKTGGIVEIKVNVFKTLNLALHNRCLKKCIQEINKTYNLNM